MANYIFPILTTAIDGSNQSISFTIQSTSPYVVESSNGTVGVDNVSGLDFGIYNATQPGWLTGRRPQLGQLFPRGVYNK
jgi:hypothetical protein